MCESGTSTKEMIERAHNGDKEARDSLVTENMGLIWSIVKRFTGRGVEASDLFQIGSIGLIKAIDNFDTSFDVRFSTYAVPMIIGSGNKEKTRDLVRFILFLLIILKF